jgi:hypothetical protein
VSPSWTPVPLDEPDAVGLVVVGGALEPVYNIPWQGAYQDQLIKEGGQWRIAHGRVRTNRLVANRHKPVNRADPDLAALVGHLLEAAQRLEQRAEYQGA